MSNEVKLNREIYSVVVLDNEWMCDEHPDTPSFYY